LTPDTKPHILDTAMSLPTHSTSQSSQQPASEPIAKIEYDRLVEYFDKLVKYSLLAITIVLGIAGAFLWKSTDDVMNHRDLWSERWESNPRPKLGEIVV
jgi:hypothetical protein